MAAQALLRERSLVYVAASRARDALHVCYSGEPSPFLAAMAMALAGKPQVAAPLRPATPPTAVDAPPPEAPAASEELTRLLAQPIADLALPTRMKNWARRAGLTTLGELTRQNPVDLLAQPNLGRKSVKDTRAFLERVTGRRWDDLAAGAPAAAMDINVHRSPWDALRARLTDAERGLPLDTHGDARAAAELRREPVDGHAGRPGGAVARRVRRRRQPGPDDAREPPGPGQ
jgi:hypothetical protein